MGKRAKRGLSVRSIDRQVSRQAESDSVFPQALELPIQRSHLPKTLGVSNPICGTPRAAKAYAITASETRRRTR